MSDITISSMPPISRPLTDEPVPCIQDGANKQAPASAFGIPVVSTTAPAPHGQFQTWIDESTTIPTLRMYIGSSWVALYTINSDGSLAPAQSVTLPHDPSATYHAATKNYVDTKPSAPGTMVFRTVYDCNTNPNYPLANKGDFYVVGLPGKIGGASGLNVETGDTLFCRVDGTAAGTQSGVGGNWTVGQGNIDGAVTGPTSSVSNNIPLFSGTTGKIIKDAGLSVDTDATMAANSDTRIPSQKAVKASIGGQLLTATDVLQQGQGWFWDGTTSAFRARSNEGQNLLVNSAFDIWQENTSYTFGGSAPKVHIADFWKVGAASSPSYTVSRVAGISNSQYAIKIQRTAGQTATARTRLAQQFGYADSLFLAGKTLTVSFDYTIGANYSLGNGPYVLLFYGTGIDEDLDLHGGAPNFTTGGAAVQDILTAQVQPTGTVARLISKPLAIPTGVTEVAFQINSAVYTGTAGADDSFTIGNIKLEVGNIATHYRKPDAGDELKRCQRRYQKSFLLGTVPAQNIGSNTGEQMLRRFGASTASEGVWIPLKSTMRDVPTITLFNPSAANAQVRNETNNADCSASAADNISDSGFRLTCTGNSTGSAGDWLGVHYVADKRL